MLVQTYPNGANFVRTPPVEVSIADIEELNTLLLSSRCWGTGEEIKKLRNTVATDSAGSSEMMFHRLPTTYSLVPVDKQVTCIDGFQLFRNGGFFILLSLSSSNVEREAGLRHHGSGLQLWRGEQINEPVEPHRCAGELLTVLLQPAPADRGQPQYTDGHPSYSE